MAKSQKELAFLRDLVIQTSWTDRFAELVDKHLDLGESNNFLYVNAGTGSHALAIDERFGEKTDVFATCENEDLLNIARDKAAAIGSEVDFSMIRFEDSAFDTVLADATFVQPSQIESFIENVVRVTRTGGDVLVFLPSAGSFGEIFSLLWEVLFNEDLGHHGEAVEKLISDIPTLDRIESIAKRNSLVKIKLENAKEVFEFENGAEFVSMPLVADFFLPTWLEMLDEKEKERVSENLAQLIDLEDGSMTFRFCVKVTLLIGEKA